MYPSLAPLLTNIELMEDRFHDVLQNRRAIFFSTRKQIVFPFVDLNHALPVQTFEYGNTRLFGSSQRRRAVGNTVSDMAGSRFKPQTSLSRDERVTVRLTCYSSIRDKFNALIFFFFRTQTLCSEYSPASN